MVDAPKLLPCPFCGGVHRAYPPEAKRIVCPFCGSAGPWGAGPLDAAEEWNRRTIPAPTPAQLLDDALRLPEVVRLVEAANRFELLSRDSTACTQEEADELIEATFAELRAALAALPKGDA